MIVEVKLKSHATDEWAAAVRRNLSAHGMVPSSAYFLLALPEQLYLWKPRSDVTFINADYKVSTSETLKGYFDKIKLDSLSEPSLQLLIAAWLQNIANAKAEDIDDTTMAWIIESGLHESIRDGSVLAEAAV